MESFINLNDLLGTIDANKIGAEDSERRDLLAEGYYVCEVADAELGTNKAQTNMQVKITLKIVENGYAVVEDESKNVQFVEIPHTKNRLIFKYYPLKDKESAERFISDMLKFEDPETPGESLIPRELFASEESIEECLALIKDMQSRIWINNRIIKNKQTNEDSNWADLVSWKKAGKLELPM